MTPEELNAIEDVYMSPAYRGPTQCARDALALAEHVRQLQSEVAAAQSRAEKLREQVGNLRHELTIQRANNHERNVALDALRYVWCNGGCGGGVCRYSHDVPVTQEVVDAAIENTGRLVCWWRNAGNKAEWQSMAAERRCCAALRAERDEARELARSVVASVKAYAEELNGEKTRHDFDDAIASWGRDEYKPQEREPVPADVHESGWQWRPTDSDTAFAPPFGTIRVCRWCGCLVAGGPTACVRCAEIKPRKE